MFDRWQSLLTYWCTPSVSSEHMSGRTASFPPGTMWPQIKIIKQETSLVLPYVQASSTGASWDYPVDLEWPKLPIIMPCQNKQLLSHHFLKLITWNMQQLPSFSHASSSCQSLRLYIWYTLRAGTFQLYTEPIIIFSYGDFGDRVLPAGCFYFIADFSHASLIDIWSTHMLWTYLERERVVICLFDLSLSVCNRKKWGLNPPLCQVRMDICLWRCIVTPSLCCEQCSAFFITPRFFCSDPSQLINRALFYLFVETGGCDC